MTDAQKKNLLAAVKGIGTPARLLLLTLTTFVNKDMTCFPSNEALSQLVGLKIRSVQGGLQELKAAGLIRVNLLDDGLRLIEILPMDLPVENVQILEPCKKTSLKTKVRAGGSANSCISQVIYREDTIEDTREERTPAIKKETPRLTSSQSLPEAVSDSNPPRCAGPSQPMVAAPYAEPMPSPRTGLAGLGRSSREWEKLFNDMMQMIGRPKLQWGLPTLPRALVMAFERLNGVMVAAQWWPSDLELKAVRWRYAQEREHVLKGCTGGHRKKTGPGFFVEEFFQVCTECETEWNFVHGVAQTSLFADEILDNKTEFLHRPIADWTWAQIRQALAWHEITEAEATAETQRRHGGGA